MCYFKDTGNHPSYITAETLIMTKDMANINTSNNEIYVKNNSIIVKC